MAVPTPLRVRGRTFRRVVVLTGAGIAASSSLPTYRGLRNADPALARSLVAGAEPTLMWQALGPLRPVAAAARPSFAHRVLAEAEADLASGGGTLTLVTQNIDGLHGRAGSRAVIELHGSLGRTRCAAACAPAFDDPVAHRVAPPCPRCGALLRPDVVLLEEPLSPALEADALRASRGADLLVAVGTGDSSAGIGDFVRAARHEGAHTICVNLTPPEGDAAQFDEVLLGSADDLLPRLFA